MTVTMTLIKLKIFHFVANESDKKQLTLGGSEAI